MIDGRILNLLKIKSLSNLLARTKENLPLISGLWPFKAGAFLLTQSLKFVNFQFPILFTMKSLKEPRKLPKQQS